MATHITTDADSAILIELETAFDRLRSALRQARPEHHHEQLNTSRLLVPLAELIHTYRLRTAPPPTVETPVKVKPGTYRTESTRVVNGSLIITLREVTTNETVDFWVGRA